MLEKKLREMKPIQCLGIEGKLTYWGEGNSHIVEPWCWEKETHIFGGHEAERNETNIVWVLVCVCVCWGGFRGWKPKAMGLRENKCTNVWWLWSWRKVTNKVWVDEQEFSPLYDFLPCKLVEHQTIAWLPTGKWETDQFSVQILFGAHVSTAVGGVKEKK